MLTHWSLGDMVVILKVQSLNTCYGLRSWALILKLFSGECHRTPQMCEDLLQLLQDLNAYLVQDCSNSIANALELLQSCTKPWRLSSLTDMYENLLVQDCSNSIANTLELLQPCTKPLRLSSIANMCEDVLQLLQGVYACLPNNWQAVAFSAVNTVHSIKSNLLGGHLNIKMPSYQYSDSYVKDKTVSPTVLSLTWESPYLGKTVFILRWGPGCLAPFYVGVQLYEVLRICVPFSCVLS